MKQRRLLYLTTHHLIVYLWRAEGLVQEHAFLASDSGFQQFSDFLLKHAASRFTVLVNVAEEAFHVETIPLVRGKEKEALIARKQNQLYYNTMLTSICSLGQTKGRRREETLLFLALTNSINLIPWFNALSLHECIVDGVYTVPTLIPALYQHLEIIDEHCLVLTVQDQSLRQTYLAKGKLIFSRLTYLTDSSVAGIARAFLSEAQKLQQYLASHRLIGRNQSLNVYLLAHHEAFHPVQAHCSNTPTLNFNLVDINAVGAKLGLKNKLADNHAEILFAYILRKSKPCAQFAKGEWLKPYRFWQTKKALFGTGYALIIASLLASCALMLQSLDYRQQKLALELTQKRTRDELLTLEHSLPMIEGDRVATGPVLKQYRALNDTSTLPLALYARISNALSQSPTISLSKLAWQNSAIKDEQLSTHQLIIEGTVFAQEHAGPRQVLADFDAFCAKLTEDKFWQLQITQRPFDIEQHKTLRGADLAEHDANARAFALVLKKAAP